MKKKVVVFTGAGISQESGLKTFRDSGGLWEEHDIMEVATPEAWTANPSLVLEFYNKRRTQALSAAPNRAHTLVAELEKMFDVQVITQNIDNLHERAGSSKVLHLHGEISKARSVGTEEIFEIGNTDLSLESRCPKGYQLRPHIVWFGEDVPNIPIAQEMTAQADILVIVGTSLNVYPAAGLVHSKHEYCRTYVIDPSDDLRVKNISLVEVIKEKASVGMQELTEILMKKYSYL